MNKSMFKNAAWAGSLVLLLFIITPGIDNYQYSYLFRKGIYEKDLLYKVLGETRNILSDYADEKGDEYLHGGIRPDDRIVREETEHEDDRYAHIYPHEHPREEDQKVPETSSLNMLPRLGRIIHISEHKHLHGEEEKELLPWFYYAVRLNPKNITAYVTGGYWIGQRLGKADEAIKFLEEGLSNNPGSWQIYAQLGELYYINKKDYKHALANLMKSYDLLNDGNSDKYNRREVYTFIAGSYEKLGETGKMLEFYKKILTLFPRDAALQKKIDLLLTEIRQEGIR